MNWKFTHIEHPARIALGLNISEYCVLDIIYQSQVHPSFTKGGWTDAGCHRIAKFLGMAPSGVKQMLDRLVKFGMIEYADSTKVLKRTTKKWYDYAYLKEEGVQNVVGGVQNVRVQKVNGGCSESEHPSVQKVNTKCSESEHKYNISNNEPNLESKPFSKSENYFSQPEKSEEICANDVVTSVTRLTTMQVENSFAFKIAADLFWQFLLQNEGQKQMMVSETRFKGTDDDLKELIVNYFASKADQNFALQTPASRNNIGGVTKWMINHKVFSNSNQNKTGYGKRNEGISPDRRAFVESLLD